MTVDPPRLLRMTRRFDASPERVFDAWLDPQATREWLFASGGVGPHVRSSRRDAQVGPPRPAR